MDEVFASGEKKALALLILDMDLFKNVNDTYGHEVGDRVLKFSANTLQKAAGENALICRWGGEEFTVLAQDEPDPQALAEQIRGAFETARITVGEAQVGITVSVGLCIVPDREPVTIAQVVKTADQCLYQAKNNGRNQVVSATL